MEQFAALVLFSAGAGLAALMMVAAARELVATTTAPVLRLRPCSSMPSPLHTNSMPAAAKHASKKLTFRIQRPSPPEHSGLVIQPGSAAKLGLTLKLRTRLSVS